MYTAQQVQGGWNVVDENKERVAGPYPSKESAQQLIDALEYDRTWEEDRKDPATRWQMEQGEYKEEPECPEGYHWNGRQCLKQDNLLRPSVYEREGF